jgi:hypothetical protein
MIKNLLQRLALVLAFCAFGTVASAQQPPDCNNCACTMPSLLGATLTTSATHGPCGASQTFNLNVGGSFGRFYGILGNRYTIAVCGATQNTMLYITTNTTVAGVITCDNDGCGVVGGASQASFIPSATNTYRVYIFNGGCGTLFPNPTNMSVTITCNNSTVPPNDLPCNAVALPMSQNCTFTPGTNVGATNSQSVVPGVGAPPSCTGALYQGADVWYTTTVPPSGLIGIQTQEASLCAGAFQIYTATACNGTFTQQAGGCVTTGLTGPTAEPATVFDAFAAGIPPGTTIYIRYWERNGNENGSFDICAFEVIRPPNDDPCGAINMPLGTACAPITYSTENASPLTNTMTAAYGTCGGGPPSNDLWFSFTVPTPVPPTGITVNSIAGTLNNMAMAWYRLSAGSICGPGTLTQIGCNQNQTAANLMPRINSIATAPLVAGETIYVRIWSETPWVGTFQICAFINQTPPNDEPCGAYPLTANYGCILSTYTNEAATQTTTTPPGVLNAPNPTCGNPTYSDVWFTAVVPPNGILQFDTQAGSMLNGGMAVYRVLSGACATNNLSLQQVAGACATAGSQQGSTGMPYLNVTGLPAGSTVYIRVWRETATATDGTFNICARRTDPPPGDCYYTLNMADAGGDGWGGSYVTVCVAGNCSNYTVNGASATVNIGANIGQTMTISYTAAGGFQNQISYVLTQYGNPVYVSTNPPSQGQVYSATVTCDPPDAPQSDCLGAVTLCSQIPQVNQNPTNTGGVADLNASNRGCLVSNERQGLWYTFTISQAGSLGFTVTPASGADYDLAVWGPYPTGSTVGNICPPSSPPLRCTYACCAGPTGLAVNSSLPTSEGAGGSGFVRHIDATVGQVYLMYIDNFSMNGVQFSMNWTGTAQVGCEILPIELLDFTAEAIGKEVQVDWSTASESNSAWYDVERSANGQEFAAIGRVDAAGNSSITSTYRFVDQDPLDGLSYYRLRQVDVQGAAVNTHAVPVLMRNADGLEVYPNPASNELWTSFVSELETALEWKITDMSGRLVMQGRFSATHGRNVNMIEIEGLDDGSYLLDMTNSDGSHQGTARFVKF